jgi:hypothetical protein
VATRNLWNNRRFMVTLLRHKKPARPCSLQKESAFLADLTLRAEKLFETIAYMLPPPDVEMGT